jgi:V8-like Glu-specific endopeptidase
MADERTERAKDFLVKVLPTEPEGGLESLAAPNPVEAVLPTGPVPEPLRSPVMRTAEKIVEGAPLTPEEDFILEAIIIPDKRPAIDVVGGDYKVQHPLWTHLNEAAAKQTLRPALRAVGRVDLPGHPSIAYGGTAFVVGPGLLMTNRHVAQIFCSGTGRRGLAFTAGQQVAFDRGRERDGAALPLAVKHVAMVHPYWDMALLAVDGLPADIAPLRLSTADPKTHEGRDVVAIGYPAFDPRNNVAVQNQVFGGVYDVKRLMPGKLTGRSAIRSFGKEVPSSMHDSSTLGGASGSAVVDVATGEVIALHFAGIYLKSNYGVPAADLARDSRVVDAGVAFSGAAAPGAGPWDDFWAQAEAQESPAAAAAGSPAPATPPALAASIEVGDAAGGARWTVPIEISITLGTPRPAGGGEGAGPAG